VTTATAPTGMFRTALTLACVLCAAALLPRAATAANPCAAPHARALVLSGGGAKGAFEAGAAYHLIVHRGCDFAEISGNSVGAINGALLAQAPRASDAAVSLGHLSAAAERLVDEWAALGGPRDVMRTRPLGKIRFALFGLDSVADLAPLQEFIHERVAAEKLIAGRELRVGVTTFVDGRYREVVLSSADNADVAHEVIFASAVVPLFGRMVRALPPAYSAVPLQLADGSLRHSTPVTSYFSACRDAEAPTASPLCVPLTGSDTPPHPRTEQLFVVVSSPFARRNDLRPVVDPRAFDRDGNSITDGRQILVRTFDLLVDTMYRDDLDDMLTYNDLLAWHARAAAAAGTTLPTFPLASYNHADDAASSGSLPYEIVLVGPQREDSDPMTIFNVEPATQRRQLFCGCIAADDAMQTRFGLPAMADRCAERFPSLAVNRGAADIPLAPAICRDERTAVSSQP
jgi:predicted acylesterase/phospholipase RssA